VSERNVELHRRLVAVGNTQPAEFTALFHPQIEFHSRFATLGAVTVYRGHDGLRRYQRDLYDVWGEDIRVEVEAYFDLGERTLVFYTVHGRGRHSGAETSMWFAVVARWQDDLCIYWKAYAAREEALAELGITEDELEPIAP
jgi:hypothetical protein